MERFHKGKLCKIKDTVEIKNKAVIAATRKSFYCFLVLKELSKGKLLVTGIYENNRKNYCIPIILNNRKLWANCALFIAVDINYLELLDGSLKDDVISLINVKHPYMMRNMEKRKRKYAFLLKQREKEEKTWETMIRGARGKNTNKKYPYGNALARREAPSARGITVVRGGGCSPR